MCTKNPYYLEANHIALMFLGLSGILRSYQMIPKRFARAVKLFVDLLELTKEVQPSSITLSFILTTSCDVRSQVAEDLVVTFRNQPSESDIETVEKAKSELLKGLSEYGRWIEFGPTLLDGILKLLKSATLSELQSQCIIALDRYWFMKSPSDFYIYNLPEFRLFVDSGIIRILIQRFPLATSDNPELRPAVLSCFEKLARTANMRSEMKKQAEASLKTPVPTDQSQSSPYPGATQSTPPPNEGNDTNPSSHFEAPREILDILESLLEEETLLDGLDKILCNTEYPDIQLGPWKEWIIALSKLRTGPSPSTSTGSNPPTSAPDATNVPPSETYEEARESLRMLAKSKAKSKVKANAEGSEQYGRGSED